MDFEEVLSAIGDFGLYQKFLFVLLCVPGGPYSAASIFSHIFVSAVPAFAVLVLIAAVSQKELRCSKGT